MTGIYRLQGTVKHYDWGGLSFIPSILKIENKENKPFAEYWMGTHPLGMSKVETGSHETKKLDELTGNLPYLFKAQEVKEMLSIQAHPSKESAEIEFARENAAGIPLDAPYRNYKDDNHKPEMLVALSDFWLLHGFKPKEELVYTLLNVVELRELLPIFNESGYAGLYKYVMEMPQEEVNRILRPLVDHLASTFKNHENDKSDEDFWASRAADTFTKDNNIDRGIFSIYLFNLVHLDKGEGIFQDAGVPHAYLEGKNVELMANSDNVLRGGLTVKHIDVKELLKHVKCEATHPRIIKGEEVAPHEKLYRTQVKDFQLNLFELGKGEVATSRAGSTEILLVTGGSVRVGDDGIELSAGNPAAVVLTGTTYNITGLASGSTVFKASVPRLG